MAESSLEKLVPEQDFRRPLAEEAESFFLLANTLLAAPMETWTKRHYFQLYSEADELESFLDDFGARYNETYHFLTELVASVRGFNLAGLSLEHLSRRWSGYRALEALSAQEQEAARAGLDRARQFVNQTIGVLLEETRRESKELALDVPDDAVPRTEFAGKAQRFRLPHNLGQEVIKDEEQKIAEVAAKYIQACDMLVEAGIRPIEDAQRRDAYLADHCTEEQGRVYEATVHNLQSSYDTYIKNTVLEASDDRLPRLRGHVSSALHLLEAVTQLTHFVERHESGIRTEQAEQRLAQLVQPEEVRDVTLNSLLVWANCLMQTGRNLATELLPSYTSVQQLEVDLADGLLLHARPASLIVSIVNHYGTPVEMEVAGQACNAGSILELMIAVGSHPDSRSFIFRGDQYPLRDIGLLFENALGENGLDALPDALSYLLPKER